MFLQGRHQFTLFTPIKGFYLNTSSMHAHTSVGQRSPPHPHVASHYFQPYFQHVNGLMQGWIHMGKVEAWIWKSPCYLMHTHAHSCTHTHQCLVSHKPPPRSAGDYLQGGDGHWTVRPHPPSWTIHDDLSTAPLSFLNPLTYTNTHTHTHTHTHSLNHYGWVHPVVIIQLMQVHLMSLLLYLHFSPGISECVHIIMA